MIDAVEATTEPAPPITPVENSTSTADDGARKFGEALAANPLPPETAPPTGESSAPPPITELTPPSAPDVGGRYAAAKPEPPPSPPTEPAEPSGAPTAETTVDALLGEQVDPNTPPGSVVNDSMPAEQREAIAENSTAPIPNLDDDEIQQPAAVQNWSTRRAAWLLGSKLSLAALGNEYGAPVKDVEQWFADSTSLANKLGVTLQELPARRAANTQRSGTDPALDYLFKKGQEIGVALAKNGGPDHAALFEVAVKSNILMVLYKPGSPTTQAIGTAIERAGERAKLPATLLHPLVDVLAAKGTITEVRKAVKELHAATDKYLDESQPK